MTELNGCVAQSHIAHETNCLRGTLPATSSPSVMTRMAAVLAVGAGAGTDAGAEASSPVGSVMRQRYCRRVNSGIPPAPRVSADRTRSAGPP